MIEVYDTPSELSLKAAERFVSIANDTLGGGGRFRVAISGGATPLGMFQILSSKPFLGMIQWGRVDIFWADERCVPPADEWSNYGQANRLFLRRVNGVGIHRVHGELPPAEGALNYEVELRETFCLTHAVLPEFDLIMLGIGEDGHTASLFPGSPALAEKKRLAVAVTDTPIARVTLTLPVLNHAKRVIFLVAGDAKAAPLREILVEGNPRNLPAGMVKPNGGGMLLWMADRAAARAIAH